MGPAQLTAPTLPGLIIGRGMSRSAE